MSGRPWPELATSVARHWEVIEAMTRQATAAGRFFTGTWAVRRHGPELRRLLKDPGVWEDPQAAAARLCELLTHAANVEAAHLPGLWEDLWELLEATRPPQPHPDRVEVWPLWRVVVADDPVTWGAYLAAGGRLYFAHAGPPGAGSGAPSGPWKEDRARVEDFARDVAEAVPIRWPLEVTDPAGLRRWWLSFPGEGESAGA